MRTDQHHNQHNGELQSVDEVIPQEKESAVLFEMPLTDYLNYT